MSEKGEGEGREGGGGGGGHSSFKCTTQCSAHSVQIFS